MSSSSVQLHCSWSQWRTSEYININKSASSYTNWMFVMFTAQHRAGLSFSWTMTNVHKNTSLCLFPLLLLQPPPSLFLHSALLSFSTLLLNGSIPVMVPEGALTLPSHSCSSPSCGAAVGVATGSLHLRGRPLFLLRERERERDEVEERVLHWWTPTWTAGCWCSSKILKSVFIFLEVQHQAQVQMKLVEISLKP